MTTSTTKALLTVEDVAAELGIQNSVLVLRLIARRSLQATKIGNSYRITRDSLDAYVGRGAPDFRAPDIDGGWFARKETWMAESFESRLRATFADQKPTNDQLISTKEGSLSRPELNFTLRTTGKQYELFDSPIRLVDPRFGIDTTPKERVEKVRSNCRFTNDLSMYLGYRLRSSALQFVRSSQVSPLHSLYASPEDYETIVTNTKLRVKSLNVAWTETITPEVGREERPRPAVLVTYRWPLSSVLDRIERAVLETF